MQDTAVATARADRPAGTVVYCNDHAQCGGATGVGRAEGNELGPLHDGFKAAL
ncbi:hypothetical protein ACXR2U_15770 [Jatrophihabitans sp. YIM 134969]